MSTISRAHRIQLTIAAATLAVALVGGIASAFAQAAGGHGGGGSGNAGNSAGSAGPNAVIVYGTPGNCPPTIACGPGHTPHLHITKAKPYDPCGEFRRGSSRYRQCRAEL